jgi:ferredoxin--NADP+ reductase
MHRAAIIGAGPAGFYAAEQLLKEDFAVDLFDRLPTPYGLVRAGVAPDHPKIKSVTRVYDRTAEHPSFRYIGGVEFGRDVTRDELLEHYHAVVYTIGTAHDRRLGIPGEDLRGSHAATEFVAWYNGHPDFAGHAFDLHHERAVVVGNGNVALDCARMLVLAADELAATDTADHAVDAFGAAAVREVVVLGRRGPAQAAFTNPELRELRELSQADVIVDPADLEGVEEPEDPTRRRNVELLRGYASKRARGKSHRIVLRFLRSPVEILGDAAVTGVRVVRNELVDGRAVPTQDEEIIPCGLVLRAVGYRGESVAGLPLDGARGVVANVDGRVQGGRSEYVAGWIKRGPSGVIGTNKKCAAGTVAKLLKDRAAGRLNTPASDADITERLRERVPALVDWNGWQAIDEAEREAGEPAGRPRVKFVRVEDMHEAASPARRSVISPAA